MNYNKYHSQKCRCLQGHLHDSKREASRCNELTILERAGEITDLRQQVKYILIPAQYKYTGERYTKGSKKGELKSAGVLEKECAYIADFDYFDKKTGKHIVEDTKGVKTKEYIIKRKLMLYIHQIRISEVK